MDLPEGVLPLRFYALAVLLPVVEAEIAGGGRRILALDTESGAFVPRDDLSARLQQGAPDIEPVDAAQFGRLLRGWRERLMAERVAAPLAWSPTGDGECPYRAAFRGHALLIRVNDFPAEPLYSVMCDGQRLGDLEDWPPAWCRPA